MASGSTPDGRNQGVAVKIGAVKVPVAPRVGERIAGRGDQRSGALRYVEAREVGGTVHLFYEMARPDGAHELRTLALAPRQLYDALDAVAGIDDDARKGAPSS